MNGFRWMRRATAAALVAAFGMLAATCAQAQSVHVIVSEPGGSGLVTALAPRFEEWRQKGLISSVRLLQATPEQPEPPAGFSTLALVTLPSPSAYRTWRAEAGRVPGVDAVVRQATVVADNGRSGDARRAVFVANFYAPKVGPAGYQFYTDRYIAPNMNQQRQAGIMNRYTMYLEQGDGGRGLLVMEYLDEQALARRDEIKKRGRKRLLDNAEWKHIDDIKESLRESLPTTTAKELPFAWGK